jgi:hypothetical protein
MYLTFHFSMITLISVNGIIIIVIIVIIIII